MSTKWNTIKKEHEYVTYDIGHVCFAYIYVYAPYAKHINRADKKHDTGIMRTKK